LVPTDDLPLQTILHFSPSLPDVATPYLQTLCLTEGYSLNPEYITQLHLNARYHSSKESSTYPPSTCDLRRTINALQIACLTINVSCPEVETTHHDDADNTSNEISSNEPAPISAKAIEATSYIDGVLGGDSPRLFAVSSLLFLG